MSGLPRNVLPLARGWMLACVVGLLSFLLVLAGAAVLALDRAEVRVASAVAGRATIAIVSADDGRRRAVEREVAKRLAHVPAPRVTAGQRNRAHLTTLLDMAPASAAELDRVQKALRDLPEASVRSQAGAVTPMLDVLSGLRLLGLAAVVAGLGGIALASGWAAATTSRTHAATIALLREMGAAERRIVWTMVAAIGHRASGGAVFGGVTGGCGLVAIGQSEGWNAAVGALPALTMAMMLCSFVMAAGISAWGGAAIAVATALRRGNRC